MPTGGDIVLPPIDTSNINTPPYKSAFKRIRLNPINENNTCNETDLPAATQKQLLKSNKELRIKKEFGRDASRKYRDKLLHTIIMKMMRHTWWKAEVYNRADMRERGAMPLSNYIFRQVANSGSEVTFQGFPIWIFPLNHLPQDKIGSNSITKDQTTEQVPNGEWLTHLGVRTLAGGDSGTFLEGWETASDLASSRLDLNNFQKIEDTADFAQGVDTNEYKGDVFHDWTHMKFVLFGAKKRNVHMKLKIVKMMPDYDPYDKDTYRVATSTNLNGTKLGNNIQSNYAASFWRRYFDFTNNYVSERTAERSTGDPMETLAQWDFFIPGNDADDSNPDPNKILIDFFMHQNTIVSYRKRGADFQELQEFYPDDQENQANKPEPQNQTLITTNFPEEKGTVCFMITANARDLINISGANENNPLDREEVRNTNEYGSFDFSIHKKLSIL